MKKILLLLLVLVVPFFAFAADDEEELDGNEKSAAPAFEEEKIIPILSSDEFIEVGKMALFDASETKKMALSVGQPKYSWRFGNKKTQFTGVNPKTTHIFSNPGRYEIELFVRQGKEFESVKKQVTVYNKKGVLVSDSGFDAEDVVTQAGEHGIWLQNIVYKKSETGFSAEEEFIRTIQEKIEFVKESDFVIFYTQSVAALQSFSQFWQKLSPENRFNVKEKLWVQVMGSSLDKASKLVQPIFTILRPNYVLLTRSESLNPIFEGTRLKREGEIFEKLKSRGIEYRLIDERSATSSFFVFSRLMTYFVSNGISQNVIYLLLAVPFIVFVISFLRQFVGISTFGVYAPLMLSLSFLVLGINFGFMAFFVVMLVSYWVRILFEKVELLYIPKVSLLLSVLSLSFFLVLGIGLYFGSSINLTLTIFPMLVMATISEKFLSAQSSEGIKQAVIATGETVFVALMGYFLVRWGWLESMILAFPEVILVPIIGNVWLGKFTGLRLSEYIKFRALLHEDASEEE